MESFLITFFCSQLSIVAGNQYSTACTNFTNATFQQTGLHNDINNFQKDAEKLGVREQHAIEETTGRTPWDIAAVGYVGYNLIKTNNLQFATSLKPIADTFRITLNQQSQNVSLSWSF